MKKLSKLLVLISVLILGISVNVFAKEDLYLVVDGKKLKLMQLVSSKKTELLYQ